jgi:hypothetical protein
MKAKLGGMRPSRRLSARQSSLRLGSARVRSGMGLGKALDLRRRKQLDGQVEAALLIFKQFGDHRSDRLTHL